MSDSQNSSSSSRAARPLTLVGILICIAFILLSFDTVWNTLVNSFKSLFDSPSFAGWLSSLTGAFLSVILLITGILGLMRRPKRRALRVLAILIFILSAAYFLMGLMQAPSSKFPFINIQTPMLVQALLAYILYKEI